MQVGGDGTGYGKPPWRFKGRALYQLHLVNSQLARALIPNHLTLVEAFGYTLGGFFLANYDDTPVGVFDELVVIAGIVWNPPTSCAWASKVLVNSTHACLHGRKDVGLPSSFATFSKLKTGPDGMLPTIGFSSTTSTSRFHLDTQVTQTHDDMFSINLLSAVPKENSKAWLGPVIKMSLPSFSGRTEDNPHLLKYTCQMECRVRIRKPLQICRASKTGQQDCKEESWNCRDKTSELSVRVMLSRPILALEFSCLNMKVEAPFVISN